jgi:hypothetical protein
MSDTGFRLIDVGLAMAAGEPTNKKEARGRRSFAPPSVLPDISPTRGEIGEIIDAGAVILTAPASARFRASA